jgi:hypothetical protein
MPFMFWQRLLRRWFIEFNPLYLLSATCVLVGVNRLSEALVHRRDSVLTVTAIAEFYAWALIGGAALLMRIGLRRPAVMLVLLAALYQGDPTMHSETCAYLGVVGVLAAALWLASFVGKLYAIAWAARVRLSRSAVAVPTLGALGLIVAPHFLLRAAAPTMTALVALWLFALFAWALSSSRRISSVVALDDWRHTVLRRTSTAVWCMWALAIILHVCFWADEFGLKLGVLLPLVLLLRTRWARQEREVWLCAASAFAVGGLMAEQFSTVAAMGALAFLLRAFREPSSTFAGFSAANPAARARFMTAAIYCAYLYAWTRHWAGGPLPEHALLLDSSLSVALALLLFKVRRAAVVVPLLLTYLHLGVEAGLVFAPRSEFQWAIVYIGVGFALLLASLGGSVYVQRFGSSSEPPD